MDVENELAIRNLIARVSRFTDQWSELTDLLDDYTEDCVWHLQGLEPYHGHEGLARRMHEMKDAGICGPGLPMRHCISSLQVIDDPADETRAEARSYVIMMTVKDEVPSVAGYGEMHDTLRRSEGRWRIAIRRGSAFW